MKTYNQFIQESIRDKMIGISDEKVKNHLSKYIIKLKNMILDFYDVTEEEVNKFLYDHFETLKWSLTQDGKSIEEIYKDWEYLMYNRFGEEKIK